MSSSISAFTASVVVLSCGILFANEAEACSGSAPHSYVAPWSGAEVPVNLGRLAWLPHPLVLQDGGVVKLVASDGGEVPLTSSPHPTLAGGFELEPAGGLAVGAYELHFSTYAGLWTAPFTVVAASPQPSQAGSLNVTYLHSAAFQVPSGSSACTSPISAAVAKLEITPSAQLEPWLDVTRWSVFVDGTLWSDTWYGGRQSDGTLMQGFLEPYWKGRVSPSWIHATCPSSHDAGFSTGGVSEGAHQVSVVAEIPGGLILPALEQTIQLTCPPSGEAGTPNTGSDGGTNDDDSSGGGCTAAPAAPLVAVAFALAAIARRKSSNRRRD